MTLTTEASGEWRPSRNESEHVLSKHDPIEVLVDCDKVVLAGVYQSEAVAD